VRVDSNRLKSLASPAFIAALTLLVVNDAALKPLFHNALTGKLSDFAGLFAFTLFAVTLWPQHARRSAVLIAVTFAFWKTSHAEPLIAAINGILPFAVGRTVDLTDLVALPMIPLAVLVAPRLTPCPMPRALQCALVVVALVAFTATSRARYVARSTMDVTQAVVVDETVLQSVFEEIADKRGLRCEVCAALSVGRVYVAERAGNVRALIVKLDPNQTLYFTATGYDRERGVRVLARQIRAEIKDRFPDIDVIDSTMDLNGVVEGESAIFVVRVRSETVDARQRAKRELLSLVEGVARAHGLRQDEESLQYYAGDGTRPEYSSVTLAPVLDDDRILRVSVVGRQFRQPALARQVADDVAVRLDATFGPENVTRHTPAWNSEWAQWIF
jgi:hypothetical protein